MLQRLLASLLLVTLLTACVDEDIDVSVGFTPTASQTPSPTLTATPTPIPATITPVIAYLRELPPTATATSAPVDTPTPYSIQLQPGGLGLHGSLIFTDYDLGLARLDLAKDTITPIFQPLPNGLVSAAALSPDGKTLLLAYSPPPSPDSAQFGFTQIYTMPADDSSDPALLVHEEGDIQLYFSPAWTPDGKSVYYERYLSQQDPSSGQPEYAVERVDYPPSGAGKTILHNVFNVAVSPDGKRLVYVVLDQADFSNDLFVSNSDGTEPQPILPKHAFLAIDISIFTPDGHSIIFAAAGDGPHAQGAWNDEFVGYRLSPSLHSIPEDLWRVSLVDHRLQRLTQLGTFGYNPSFSPDGRYIAFSSVNGIFVMRPDGSDLTQIYSQSGNGTLQWVP